MRKATLLAFVLVAGAANAGCGMTGEPGNEESTTAEHELTPPKAAAPPIEWIDQFSSTVPASDEARAIATNGDVYVVGSTSGSLPGQFIDALVIKYDRDGNTIWTRHIGDSNSNSVEEAFDVAVDETGLYVVGQTSGALAGQTNLGSSDAFIQKYDFDGDLLWTQQFGTSGSDAASRVAVAGGRVAVTGFVSGTLPGQTSSGATDTYYQVFEADGTMTDIRRQFGSSSTDLGRGIAISSQGIYVSGVTLGQIGATSFGDGDVFVARFDETNALVDVLQFGTSGSDTAWDLERDGLEALYVVGATSAALPGQTHQGGTDAFMVKLAPDLTMQWTRQYGTDGLEEALAVSVGADGIYTSGRTSGAFPGHTNAGGFHDAFVRKFDASGDSIWTRQFGSDGPEEARGIAADATGVYVAGETQGTLVGPPNPGRPDVFVQKYDLTGQEQWTRQFGSTEDGRDAARAADADGFVYAVGYTTGALPGEQNLGRADVFLRKYDPAGQILFTVQFGTVKPEVVFDVAVSDAGIFVSGQIVSPSGRFTTSEAFLAKFDHDGKQEWMRTLALDGAFTIGYGVAVDETGVYLAGNHGTTSGLFGGPLPSQGFVRKYDFEGQALWTREFGTPDDDFVRDIEADASGVYVAGFTEGAIAGVGAAGGTDVLVRKFTRTGDTVWTRQFGSSSDDVATGLAAFDRAIYVSGTTEGALAGQEAAGERDAFLHKLDEHGDVLWTRQFGTPAFDEANDVDADELGAYIAGATEGNLAGQPSAGGVDAFVGHFDPDGGLVWIKQIGSAAGDWGLGVAAAPHGIYLSGETEGALGEEAAIQPDAFVLKLSRERAPDECFVIRGDVVVRSSADANRLAAVEGCFEITGHLFVERTTGIQTLGFLRGLRAVGGYVGISRNRDLATLQGLQELEFVGEGLVVAHNPRLLVASAAIALHTLEGPLHIFANPNLRQVGFPSLESAGPAAAEDEVAFVIAGNDELTSLRLPALTRIEGTAIIENNDVLENVDLGALEVVEGTLRVAYNHCAGAWCSAPPTEQGLRELVLESLRVVGGELQIIHNAALRVLLIPRLENVSGVELRRNDMLQKVDLNGFE